MSTERFAYRGPATIAGIRFPDVVLREEQNGGLRSWNGRATTTVDLSAHFLNSTATTVELPDGRTGTAYLSISGEKVGAEIRWTVDITGTGPAPGVVG